MTTTVFISYSRKDAVFVRQLHEALAAQDRQTWVDWEGIPPSAEWMKQIVDAIDAAGAFVFVITPDSLASSVCRDELGHAVEQNKRLIPVLRREVEPSTVPETLAKVNWIFFRDPDDFDGALRILTTAVDTDLDWVEAHTRLLVRAREWDTKGRENSLALRGKDLKTAEQWLTLGPTKQPQPTELQTVYILGSRKAATNRRYVLLGSAMIGLVAVAILATTTYFGRRDAARQQTIAIAGRLTGDAELLRDEAAAPPGDTGLAERSALLATEAASRLASIGTRSLQTDIAMRRSLALLPNRVHRFEHDDLIFFEELVLTDERLVGVAKEPLAVGHWLVNGTEVAKKRVDGTAELVTISPDGKFIATAAYAHESGVIDVWDTTNLERLATIHGVVGAVDSLALSPGAQYLAMNAPRWDAIKNVWVPQPVRVWFRVGKELHELANLPTTYGLVFSPHGAWLAGSANDKPKVWAVAGESNPGLEEVRLPAVPPDFRRALFSADGKQMLLVHGDKVRTLTVGDWKTVREFKHDWAVWALAPEGRFIALTGEDPDVPMIVDTEGRQVVGFRVKDSIRALAFSPNSETIAIAGVGHAIDLFRIAPGGSDVARVTFGADMEDMAFGADETSLVTVGRSKGGIAAQRWSWAQTPNAPAHVAEISGDLATLSADARFVAVAAAQKVIVASAADGRTVREMSFQGSPTAIALSPEGAFVAVATDDKAVLLWPTQSDREPQRFAVPENVAHGELAVGLSGTPLIAIASEGQTRAGERFLAHTWNPPDARETAHAPTGTNRSGFFVRPCALSADARYLASEQAGTLVVKETQTDRIVARLGGSGTCTFSADSTRLATTGPGVVRVWDIATQTEIARIETEAAFAGLSFSPHNRYLATAGDGVVRIWLLEPRDLIDLACARGTRNLSLEEKRNYFGDAPDQPTCAKLPVPDEAPRD